MKDKIYFEEIFIKNYNKIKRHGSYKFNLTSPEANDIMSDIYINICSALSKEKERDLGTENRMMNYIYYSFSSYIKNSWKKNKKEIIIYDESKMVDQEINNKNVLEEQGKDIFFNEVFNYLNQLVEEKTIDHVHVSIYKYYLYHNKSVIQISNATKFSRYIVKQSIDLINNLLKDNVEIEKLKNKYLTL